MRHRVFRTFFGVFSGLVLLSVAAFAQDLKPGKLKVSVHPKQAYTFVDGKAIGPGNRKIKLDVGTHHLVVAITVINLMSETSLLIQSRLSP